MPWSDTDFWETHSKINSTNYRSMGLGKVLYSRAFDYALKHGMKLMSSDMPSDDALTIWNSKTLNSKFRISFDRKLGRFVLRGRR